jgi:hypothetical protein
MKSRLDLGFVAQPRNRPPTSSCCSCHHAARTRPRWSPGPSNEAYLSSPHLEASPATTFRTCSSPAPTQVKPQPTPAIPAKNQSTQRCQSLITQGSDHPPVLEPHMVLIHKHCFLTLSIFSMTPLGSLMAHIEYVTIGVKAELIICNLLE